jgi:ankyrin repeat protein
MIVAGSGSVDAIKVLLDRGASVNAAENAHGQTALVFAAAYNRGAAVRMLIARGANPEVATKLLDPGCGSIFNRNECDEVDQYGKPVLSKAASADVKAGDAPKNKQGERRRRAGATVTGGMTPLLFAARDGQTDAAHALVESGANINNAGAGEKMTPIVMAIANGHYDLAKYLLDHGADPNKSSAVGLTPLYATLDMEWAPYSWLPQPITAREATGYLDLMKALLAKGANPNVRLGAKVWFRSLAGDHGWVDPAGATAFWRAAQATDLAAMHLLVAAGADPKIAAANGSTPLMVAAGLGWAANFSRNAPDSWMEAVRYCLDLGIDVNARDTKDYTALQGAAFRGDTGMAAFLVEKGARTDVVNKDGYSAADMANGPIEHSEQHPETVALLRQLGSPFANDCRSSKCFIVDGTERKRLGN